MFLGLLTPKRPPPDKHCGILTEGKSVYFLTLSCRVLGSSLTGSLQSNSVQDRNKSRQFNLKTMATLFGNVFSGSKRDPTELVYTSALLWSNVLALSLGTVRRHGQLLRYVIYLHAIGGKFETNSASCKQCLGNTCAWVKGVDGQICNWK